MSENQIPPTIENPSQARTWNMLCHLSALSGFVIPFGNFLGPLLIWQIKKDEIPSVEIHGKSALNFQITFFIFALVLGMVGAVTCLLTFGLSLILFIPIFFSITVVSIIFPIIAAVKANSGEIYKYPISFELIK